MAEDAPASPTPADTSVVANAAETDAPVASPKPDAPASESANASPKPDAAADSEEAATKEAEETTPETTGSPAPTKTASAAVATPASKKKAVGKRKSLANLKTPSKKGADPDKKFTPGQYVMAKMKSYPPWPAIVLNDELLPEVLKKGPQQGKSKNAPTDTGPSAWKTQYPIFFMGTFEYAWTSIADLDELTDDLLKAGPSRKTKGLPEAFTAVEEGFSLKDVKDFQEGAMEVDDEPEAVEESDEMDVDEEEGSEQPSDDDEPKNKKKARGKKRKADTEEEAESEKPAKTPKKAAAAKTPKTKTPKSKPEAKTPKAKTPKTAAAANGTKSAKKTPAAKKATPASKKKTPAKKSNETVEDSDDETAPKEGAHKDEIVDTKGLNVARQQEVMMFRRHKLQKVFLNKDDTPVPAAEMPRMAKYLESLENWENLTAEVIKNTKIHKVVKGIFKHKGKIPLDDEYHFRERCQALFEKWSAILEADEAKQNGEAAPADDKKTNGDDKEEEAKEGEAKEDETKEDEAKEETASEDKPEEESKDEPTKAVDVVKETPPAKEDTPAATETTDVVVGEEKKDTPAAPVVTETTETTTTTEVVSEQEKPVVEEASVEEPTT